MIDKIEISVDGNTTRLNNLSNNWSKKMIAPQDEYNYKVKVIAYDTSQNKTEDYKTLRVIKPLKRKYKDYIIQKLHCLFRKDKITNDIIESVGFQLDKIESYINEIEIQNYVDSATWGLDIFEKDLNIKNNSLDSLESRRKLIKAKWKGTGKLTLNIIQDVLNEYTQRKIIINFLLNGLIEITFSRGTGKPKDLNKILNIFNEIKPAHLGFIYNWTYSTWQDVKENINSFDNIKNNFNSWNDIYNFETIKG